MDAAPEKFFVGVVDLFSVLLPGALVAYLSKDRIACQVLGRSRLPLQTGEEWMIFLFLAYLFGHFIFLIGAVFDRLYDALRESTDLGQCRLLAKGKSLASLPMRWMARWVFGKNADAAVTQALRIKSRALSGLAAENSINLYQWCKALLSKEHPAGLAAVQRFEADSKFFRSFTVVLIGLFLTNFVRRDRQHALTLAALCLALLLLAFWRYVDQRFKATQQAYWLAITLESANYAPRTQAPFRAAPNQLTHAGGVVFRRKNGSLEYLLITATANRKEWVLPKGHIELGESPQETAVREVREETGYWARVIHRIRDVSFGDTTEAELVRFFLLELITDGATEKSEESRQQQWLNPDGAEKAASHQETKTLLKQATEWLRQSNESKF